MKNISQQVEKYFSTCWEFGQDTETPMKVYPKPVHPIAGQTGCRSVDPQSVIRAFDYTFHVVHFTFRPISSAAGILLVILLCRSPLRLQQTDNPSARPSSETDSESNDRFGLKTRCNAAMEGSWTTGTWTLFRRFPKGKEKETGNGGNPSAPIPNQRTTGGRLMRTARCSIMDGQAVCQIPIFLRMSLGMAFLLTM